MEEIAYPGVRKRGPDNYDFRLQLDGKLVWEGGFPTALDAHIRRQLLKRGEAEPGTLPDKNTRFLPYALKWLETITNPKTKASYRSIIMIQLACFHLRTVSSIKTADVIKLIEDMKGLTYARGGEEREYGPDIIRNTVSRLSTILTLAVVEGLYGEHAVNPCDIVWKMGKNKSGKSKGKIPPRARRRVHLLSADEAEHVLAVAEKKDPKWRVMVAIALYAGVRKQEILDLVWERIDFERNLIFFTAQSVNATDVEVKTEASSFPIALPKVLKKILLEWKMQSEFSGDSDPVIPSIIGTPVDGSKADKIVRRISQESGVFFSLHTLRHGIATTLIRSKVPDFQVALQMRHADASTSRQVYAHIYSEAADRQAAVTAIEDHFSKKEAL